MTTVRPFLGQVLKRIKRCVIAGRIRFTFKAELEMLGDQLSRTDVVESILNAREITKVLRSRRSVGTAAGEHLYVIHGPTYDDVLVYTKGKLHHILISSKRALGG